LSSVFNFPSTHARRFTRPFPVRFIRVPLFRRPDRIRSHTACTVRYPSIFTSSDYFREWLVAKNVHETAKERVKNENLESLSNRVRYLVIYRIRYFEKKTTRRSRISATAERPIAAIYFRLDLFGFCSRLLALRNGEYLTINTPPPLISRRSTREKVFSEILRRTGEKNSRNIRLALDVRYVFFEYGANDNSFVVIP